jgi:hypothetical protein
MINDVTNKEGPMAKEAISRTEVSDKKILFPVEPSKEILCTFAVNTFNVREPRSGSLGGLDKGNDSDYVGLTVQVNNNPNKQATKFIGNNCHSGIFNVGLGFSDIQISDTDAVVMIVTIVNSSQGVSATTKYLESAMSKLASAAGSALGKVVAQEILTQGVKDAIGAAIGATIGTAAVPLIGSALGALGGFLIGEAWGILFPNCDGPVAASVFVYSGAEIRAATANGAPMNWTVNYPGIDSADGCGDNSNYDVSYSITARPVPGVIAGTLEAAALKSKPPLAKPAT